MVSLTSPLISAEELRTKLGDRSLKIFDVRGAWGVPPIVNFEAYAEAHIPGAVFLDWSRYFVDTDVPINLANVASRAQAQSAFERLGISKDDTLVLYDDYHHMLAARTWWSMRYWGFEDVLVLDGGWKRWTHLDYPITKDPGHGSKGDFNVEERADLSVSIDQVANRDASVCLIDGRGAIGYAGNAKEPRSGHIPGAVNVPFKDLLDEQTGMFKSKAELLDRFRQLNPDIERTAVISSCGAGYAGSIILLGLSVVGIDAPLFDGSFSAWKQDSARLVEQSLESV